MSLSHRINQLTLDERTQMLQRCCGSSRWVNRMLSSHPFQNDQELFQVAEQHWWSLSKADFLEAFSHHPKIGGNLDALRQKFSSTHNWSTQEQAGVTAASEETLRALSDGNIEYEDRFGYIFIVCATGKSATEMLSLLQTRLNNDPESELRIAAGEQAKITRIRMEKWNP